MSLFTEYVEATIAAQEKYNEKMRDLNSRFDLLARDATEVYHRELAEIEERYKLLQLEAHAQRQNQKEK